MAANEEIWAPVKGFERLYEVSNFGNVKSCDRVIYRKNGVPQHINGRVLRKHVGSTGYWTVHLYVDGVGYSKKVHRLVASAFIDNPENKREVNHIDGDKLNCNVSNLEWVTPSENMQHAFTSGLTDMTKCRESSVKVRSRAVMRSDGVIFDSLSDAAERNGISLNVVYDCCRRKVLHPDGYVWRYCDEAEVLAAEEWRSVSFEQVEFEVSSWGRVRGASIGKRSVMVRDLCRSVKIDTRKSIGFVSFVNVSYLVAKCFVENPFCSSAVIHKNGDVLNDCSDNIAWFDGEVDNSCVFGAYSSVQENEQLKRYNRASTRPKRRRVIRSDGKVYESIKDASLDAGIKYGTMQSYVAGSRRPRGGYTWRLLVDDE